MRFLFFLLAALFIISCSNGDCLPLDPGPDADYPRSTQRLFKSWDQVSFYVDPNHFFGDTNYTEFPDNTLEIGYDDNDTLLTVRQITIPLMDRIHDAWFRNYLSPSNLARSFRLVVEANETTDVDSVILEVRTKNKEGVLYGDIPPVQMTFYKAAKNNGKIYFQNLIKKDTTLGIPVLFSQAPIDGGAFEEAYVLVLKDTSDLWHFEYMKMPEPIKPCPKEWICYETMESFSDYKCPESSSSAIESCSSADMTLLSSSSGVQDSVAIDSVAMDSLAKDTITVLEPIRPIDINPCYTVTGWRYVTRCDSVCSDQIIRADSTSSKR